MNMDLPNAYTVRIFFYQKTKNGEGSWQVLSDP